MTDKQIIIDVCPYQGECSVSGCKRNDDGCFVRQLFEERDRAENRIVEFNKKIQAKEQECDELKKIIDEAKNSKLDLKSFLVGEAVQNEYEQQLDKLKAENETLFKAIEEVNKINKKLKANLLDQEAETLKAGGIIHKLEKTLTEIKDIAEHCMKQDICTTCDNSDKCHIEDEEIPTYDVCKLILQKISEVEDD